MPFRLYLPDTWYLVHVPLLHTFVRFSQETKTNTHGVIFEVVGLPRSNRFSRRLRTSRHRKRSPIPSRTLHEQGASNNVELAGTRIETRREFKSPREITEGLFCREAFSFRQVPLQSRPSQPVYHGSFAHDSMDQKPLPPTWDCTRICQAMSEARSPASIYYPQVQDVTRMSY